MPDYSKGKIYRLVSPSGLTYIGSTCQSLAVRKAEHKRHYFHWRNGKFRYVTSFKIFEDDLNNYDIVLIENYPCESKEELHKRERHWIEQFDCVNKIKPGRTDKEYYEDNRDEKLK